MREDDGRRLDHATLQTIRIQAVRRIVAGESPETVAQALGFNRSTVFAWVAKYRAGGLSALLARPVTGRPARLSDAQHNRLYSLLVGARPHELRLGSPLWTRELVRKVIMRDFRVTLSDVSVGRLLHRLGLAPLRPLDQAMRANPAAVLRWKATELPLIRDRAATADTSVYFGATTRVRQTDTMIYAGTAAGPLCFAVYPGPPDKAMCRDFLDRLREDAGGTVFLVTNECHIVEQPPWLHVFRLPG
jgi:transposase